MSFSVQSLYSWYGKLIRKPKYRWWVIMGTIVYLVSPIDIAPDFIPVVGQIDDLVLLTLLVSEVSKLVIEGWKSSKAKTNSPVKDVDSKDAVIEVTKQ
ncbi:YkvA family protein [Cylindrospermopsis raciborskii]|uniref:DUF1232 domain-containing protein n=1 Tax=Cylindrospermopsis raciborskii CENA302 TaxID=1170768 RepID=A0A9Q5QX67_9CYAN|nr:YkvA family protein [Cylindrospermopsis raciborskii]NLQ05735.1 DUF1232 domain-containing protein [Cylindrospermopsis raciborskii MVCC19]OHY36350.1 hypothetical protein BCV64_00840 [Cylindrospermopsis raciborskii MVCC14]OPH09799.1 hypothetical protein CENA302_08380 [Cylindrospermopsis raciborskii CENA302]